MEELLKFVGALPLPAAIAFSAVSAIVIWVARLGILEGRKLPPGHDAPAAQVAAVIVDPTALNAATAALNRHTTAVENAATVALNRHTNAVERLIEVGESVAKSIDHMATELDRIREELRIQREIERRRN